MNGLKNTKRMNIQLRLQIFIILIFGFTASITVAQSDINLELKTDTKLFVDAIGKGDCDAINSYLNSGTSSNIKFCSYDGREVTALMFAASQGHTCAVNQLIAAGANINVISHPSGIEYDTPLTLAIKRGGLATVDLLLKSNSRVNVADENGQILVIQALNNADEWSALPGHPSKEDVQRMRALVLDKLGNNLSSGVKWNAVKDALILGRCTAAR